MELLTRLFLALTIVAGGVAVYQAWSAWQLSRLRRATGPGTPPAPGLEGWQPGRPGILYFTSPDCVPCRTAQRPALERLRADLGGELQVVEVDASAQTAVADFWGVLSVPTTFVLDHAGAPRHVNPGVASADKLKRQLQTATGMVLGLKS